MKAGRSLLGDSNSTSVSPLDVMGGESKDSDEEEESEEEEEGESVEKIKFEKDDEVIRKLVDPKTSIARGGRKSSLERTCRVP